jgi:hypothetical protein
VLEVSRNGYAESVTLPVPLNEVSRELEALKDRLIDMSADDLTQAETDEMSREISAIRLQLKRLALDQQAIAHRLRDHGLVH